MENYLKIFVTLILSVQANLLFGQDRGDFHFRIDHPAVGAGQSPPSRHEPNHHPSADHDNKPSRNIRNEGGGSNPGNKNPKKDPFKNFNRTMPDGYVFKAPKSKFLLKNARLYRDLSKRKVKGESMENVKAVTLDLIKEADALYKKSPKEAEKLYDTAKQLADFVVGISPVGVVTDLITGYHRIN